MDVQFVSLIMYWDYAIVFGFVVPVMLPLVSVALFMQGATIHHVVSHFRAHLDRDLRPSLRYLWFSVIMGYMVTSWTFYVGEIHGCWLVLYGIPVCIGVSVIGKWQAVLEKIRHAISGVVSSGSRPVGVTETTSRSQYDSILSGDVEGKCAVGGVFSTEEPPDSTGA